MPTSAANPACRSSGDRGWERWNRDATYESTTIADAGPVTSWTDVTTIDGPLVTFRTTWIFAADGETLTSTSTLRFRRRAELEDDLTRHGYLVPDVRDAPDRPGRELVFLAQRHRDVIAGNTGTAMIMTSDL
jgi:hypothetical protein